MVAERKQKLSNSTSPEPKKRSVMKSGKALVAAKVTEESILEGTIPFQRASKDSDFTSDSMVKILSWNVAGLRAVMRNWDKEFHQLFETERPDVVCLQETKLQPNAAENAKLAKVSGYVFYESCSSAKKGYSGTRIYVRDSVPHRIWSFHPSKQCSDKGKMEIVGGNHSDLSRAEPHDAEGRIIVLEFATLFLVNTYVPNAGMELKRLSYRVSQWDRDMKTCLQKLQSEENGKKSVIWAGDLNVAERDYDRYFQGSYAQMQKCAGFTPEERASFRALLTETSMVDSFRHLYPNASKAYTFWSARIGGRARGLGWRLDYFVLSRALLTRLVDSFTLPNIRGSDHCPIALWLKGRL